MAGAKENRYKQLIEHIFFDIAFGAYKSGDSEIPFARPDIERAAAALGITLPKNLGDIPYSIRYRTPMPQRVLDTQPVDREWIIEGDGRARYKFVLVPINRIVPRQELMTIKVPDATPEIIGAYALNDEQALLARVRYNRLIDVFLGITAYSLQNHMRTTVSGIGQIEIDEVYVGIDRNGVQYVIPVQDKGGKDQLSVVQSKQDIAWCAESDHRIAMFELTVQDARVCVMDEKHYRLVPAGEVSLDDLRMYRRNLAAGIGNKSS